MKLQGSIENIRFRNETNGWTVLLVKSGKAVFTLVGNVAKINAGESIEAEVTEVEHPTFGRQYKILSYQIVIPDKDENAIRKFLISLSVKGIGEVTIDRIIANFRTDTIEIIKNEKEKLYGIKGLNEEKIEKLRERLLERNNEINVILQLEKYELGTLTLTKILDRYGDKALDVINENPYRLAMDIEGIGFNICDKIAKMNGFSVDNEKRTMAGIIYILENEYSYGNVYVTREVLEKEARELLKLDDDFNFDDVLYNLEISLKIKRDKFDNTDLVFLKSAYNIEKALTEYLYNLKDNIVIVTGGPGTGKTYNIKQYLNDAREVGLKVALCAPTGRATKRITEVTGYEAKTIHRLLECVGDSDGKKNYFSRNEDNKLDIDVLIVDEMSMVDEYLMLSLMKAVPTMAKIILVGDVDQLPSVGAGQVLMDMIQSKLFDVKELTKIYRQDEASNIVINAHHVNAGESVNFVKDAEDFIFTHKYSEDAIKDAIKTLVRDNLPRHFNCAPDQIQVICPSKKGNCGTESLNIVLQNVLNEESFDKSELSVGNTVFRVGDKVMQTANNYNIPYDVEDENGHVVDRGVGIFNGDIGIIKEIDDENRNMVIKFDDRVAYYISKELSDLSLAYAITVHKSQGSEYDVVVMPMARAPYQLLNRKILYTAMTRAKKCIIFVGIEQYFNDMINNKNEIVRNSALCSKLYLYDFN
ncbi:MAG: AAA family ATPase [Lachnospiraceae bacterium]|nr:AAA family ATPase [Lachnospiraceae bacterium]